ncbi:MAG: hypothetical protein KDE32_03105 [Novosphingobium sp.]|nr:hypothetical protein [Novosphingobium sp.]
MRTVLLASAAAALPLAGLSLAPVEAVASAVSPFVPSSEPMVLTRTLRRPLPGGITIATARSYRIHFVPEGTGFRIEGELIGVDIEAPRQFEALMAMERARPDTGMFPMRIDAQGRFLSAGERDQESFAAEAGRQAQALVPASLPAAEARDADAFIGQATANPIQTAWPEDLFRPAPGKHSNTNVMPLPGGKTGQVSIEIDAEVDSGSGLLFRLQRSVTTRLGDSTRITEETWTLTRKE